MRRLLFLLLIALILAAPVMAQDDAVTPDTAQAPDYQIIVMASPSLAGSNFTVEFGIINIAGAAETEATVILTVATTGQQLGIKTVPAIPSQGTETVTFEFPASDFPAGSTQSLQATVGIDEIEQRGSATIGNNSVRVGFNVPQNVPTAEAGSDSASQSATGTSFTIPGINLLVDLNNPTHLLILIGVIVVVLILLWVAVTILRLIFQKTPTIGQWQPPYASLSVVDPDSAAGRRQLWQPHAQNDALMLPCAEGAYHIRKLLMGADGAMLSGWRMTSLRLSQYDMYGRVARTHTLASNGLVKRLDKAAHRRELDMERAQKAVRPVARSLVAQFDKRLSKKNAGLPIALDLRIRGTHGEARILFELFGCRHGEWQLIDSWEPEMIVVQGAIGENFTYTMFGQHQGEQYKDYRRRIEEELTRTLAEMILRQRASAPVAAVGPSAQVQTPRVEEFVHQDTAPHPPSGY